MNYYDLNLHLNLEIELAKIPTYSQPNKKHLFTFWFTFGIFCIIICYYTYKHASERKNNRKVGIKYGYALRSAYPIDYLLIKSNFTLLLPNILQTKSAVIIYSPPILGCRAGQTYLSLFCDYLRSRYLINK